MTPNRQAFEDAMYRLYQQRLSENKINTDDQGDGTRESLFWKQPNGEYGVLMFNAAWAGWQMGQEALLCECKDRPAAQCPGSWEPGCDLGQKAEHAKVVDMGNPISGSDGWIAWHGGECPVRSNDRVLTVCRDGRMCLDLGLHAEWEHDGPADDHIVAYRVISEPEPRFENTQYLPTTTSDSDGWIAWTGGKCPVQPSARVAVRFRNGMQRLDAAWFCCWSHDGGLFDIVAYCVVTRSTLNGSEGWTDWDGVACPVPHDTKVEVRFRAGYVAPASCAGGWEWSQGVPGRQSAIVAYRVLK